MHVFKYVTLPWLRYQTEFGSRYRYFGHSATSAGLSRLADRTRVDTDTREDTTPSIATLYAS